MPFPNHHSGRLVDPKKFDPDSFRQKRRKTAKGRQYTVIMARFSTGKSKGSMGEQAYRYASKAWTSGQARAHAKKHNAILFEPASKTATVAASEDPLELSEDVTICPLSADSAQPASGRRTVGGVPIQRFLKRLIYEGQFVKESEGNGFSVSPACIKHWAKTHKAMKANGTVVRIPNKHSSSPMPENPKDCHGEVVDMFTERVSVKGEDLLCLSMTCDIKGKDSIEAATKNDVSVFAPREWSDSAGNRYVRPITHVAMVPDPLIQGLGGFIPLAASQRKEKTMEFLKALQEKLGLEDELTEENAVELVASQHEALVKERDELKASAGEDDDKGDKNKKKDEEDPLKVVSPELLRLSMKDRKRDFDDLVPDHITPAARDELVKSHVTETLVASSLQRENSRTEHDALIASLRKNIAIKTGEKTSAQVLEDQLKGPDGKGDNPLIASAKEIADKAKGKS